MKPKRIQRKRTKGWRKPPNTVCVSRPSKWSNPFKVSGVCSRQKCVELFRDLLYEKIHVAPEYLTELKAELGTRNLACWCPLDQPCHADILLELANQE